MALTKPQFYLGFIFIFGILSFSILSFGEAIYEKSIDPNNDIVSLDAESIAYIGNYSGTYNSQTNNAYDLDATDVDGIKLENPLLESNETGTASVTDFLANINFYTNKIQPLVNKFKLFYNFPTFVLLTYGLDVAPFSPYINIFVYTLGIAIVLFLIKMVSGGFN